MGDFLKFIGELAEAVGIDTDSEQRDLIIGMAVQEAVSEGRLTEEDATTSQTYARTREVDGILVLEIKNSGIVISITPVIALPDCFLPTEIRENAGLKKSYLLHQLRLVAEATGIHATPVSEDATREELKAIRDEMKEKKDETVTVGKSESIH